MSDITGIHSEYTDNLLCYIMNKVELGDTKYSKETNSTGFVSRLENKIMYTLQSGPSVTNLVITKKTI